MIDYQLCTRGDPCENVEHYFLHCNNFRIYRNKLFDNSNSINVDDNINNLLTLVRVSFKVNCAIFAHVQILWIKEAGRFIEY